MRGLHAAPRYRRLATKLNGPANDNYLPAIPPDFALLICKGFAAAIIVTAIATCLLYASYIFLKLAGAIAFSS